MALLLSNSKSISEDNINPNKNRPDLMSKIERITYMSNIPAMKFLGVYFDPYLNFRHNWKYISSKISRALYTVHIMCSVKIFYSWMPLKLSTYYPIIHCNLCYQITELCQFRSSKWSFFIKQLLLVPMGMPRNDFEFFWFFVDLFVFVIDSLVMNTPGSQLESLQ